MNASHDAAIAGRVDEPRAQFLTGFQRKPSPATYFEWSSANEIGHTQMDEQHKRLFLLGAALVEPLSNTREHKRGAVQLQAFIHVVQEHFAFEQGLMRSAGYPGADQHAKYHTSLLAELRTYCFKVQRGLHTNPVGLLSFLSNWFTLEIDSADRDLVAWLGSAHYDSPRSN